MKFSRERQRTLRAYRRRVARFGVLAVGEEEDIAELEAEEMAASLAADRIGEELSALIRLGEAAAPHDPKLAALVLEIRLIRLHHPDANVIVYTEYVDSQRAAITALAAIGGMILCISGADPEAERTRVAERFAEADGLVLVSTDSLAEGLNLQQRCFHLIHLDLPYNPNRLEQRNGRIDRYGQRNDPQIRYLYLAGTFEERLLLRLIAKYEKARACLAFMPNTIGVRADAASLHEPLFAGFGEDLFSGAPRLVHSLDLAAEDTDSESYRDLLREIDRAFQSFDHMAVRHGWLSGGESVAMVPAESEAAIDLPAFVASVLTQEGDAYRVPAGWEQDLDGLPGFDAASATVRLTDDPLRLRDAQGRNLLYPGRSHPLTRRAIAAVRTGRVGVARPGALSLLVTYTVETGSLLRRVFALLLLPDGSIHEQDDFLSLADKPYLPSTAEYHTAAGDDAWHRCFAGWAPDVLAAAEIRAAAIADRIVSAFAAEYQARTQRANATAQAWLLRRSNEICGAASPATGDLFADAIVSGDWRGCSGPEQRLTGFTADAAVPAASRREAAEILSRFRTVIASRTVLPSMSVRRLGLLMRMP